MELKEGYKQTEIGVIPEGWRTTRLGDFLSLRRGHDLTGHDRRRGDVPVMGSAGQNGFHDTALVKGPGIVLGRSGASFGQAHFCKKDFWPHNTGLYVTDFLGNDKLFAFYILTFLDFSQHNSGGAQQSLNRNFIAPIPIFIPSVTEQEAIAGALSDVDMLISSLGNLITKKRYIKQGTMRELLRPKEGWVEYSFPDVCWFQEGPGVRNTQFTNSGVKLFNGTNIEKGKINLDKTNRYISEKEAYGWYSHFLAEAGDIVIACSGVSIDKFDEKVAVLQQHHLPLCMNTSTMRFKVKNDKFSAGYLKHFLRSDLFKQQIGGKATGSAQLNFGPSHICAVEIAVPTIAKQITIATILSDMDAEITALQEKLSKTHLLKQGMMAELLTGRIRLVEPQRDGAQNREAVA